MNKSDKKILELLQEDARYGAGRIATMLGMDEKSVEAAVSRMEEQGIIAKYTAVINEDKLDDSIVSALIEVKVTPQRRSGFDQIAREIMRFDEVKAVYLMSGMYDLSITVEADSIRGISLFVSEKLSTIDSIVGISTHFIMKKYKDGGVILDKGEVGTRLAIHE